MSKGIFLAGFLQRQYYVEFYKLHLISDCLLSMILCILILKMTFMNKFIFVVVDNLVFVA